MIDLHAHILPGVDDGVKTEDESVEFARAAAADGIRTLVATPHCKDGFFENDRGSVLAAVARLRARLAGEGVPLEVVPGAEVHLAPDLPARVRDGRAPTLGDNGRTLLLELSLSQYPVDLENLVFRLRLAGILTVFAHPERIRYFQEDVRRYEAVVKLGAFGQITAGSVLGGFGREVKEFGDDLLRRRLVHVVASDSHDLRGRRPAIREAVRAIAAMMGEGAAAAMVESAPRALLEGREPEAPDLAPEAPARRRWLAGLFRRSGEV